MFAAFAKDAALAVNDASAPTAKDDFVNDPEKLCTEIVVRDQQNQVAFHYRVQDSPGTLSLSEATCHCWVMQGAGCGQEHVREPAIIAGRQAQLASAARWVKHAWPLQPCPAAPGNSSSRRLC